MGERPRFSTRQVTAMVVAVCAAIVLAPVGVFAASHDKIEIVDPSHASQVARVSSSGALSVKASGTTPIAGAVRIDSPAPFAAEAQATQAVPNGVSITLPSHAVEIQMVSVFAGFVSTPGGVTGQLAYVRAGKARDVYFAVPSSGAGSAAAAVAIAIYPDAGSKVTITAIDANLAQGSLAADVSGVSI